MTREQDQVHLISPGVDGIRDPRPLALCGVPITWGVVENDLDMICGQCEDTAKVRELLGR